MKAKPPLEQEILRQCLQWLRLHRVFAWRQNQGAMTGTHKGKRWHLQFAGVEGISDIIGVLPGGRFLAAECKRAGNKPTPTQTAFLEDVNRRGGVGIVVRSVDELAEQLGPYLEG